ncbi:uncharacterized protein, partial [Chiloscyllium punctatum]|uniref:uncharacterized protein n=1 Tax=Chiloscyllium punctatum TaxID=137246 RepID=UPI003B63AB66
MANAGHPCSKAAGDCCHFVGQVILIVLGTVVALQIVVNTVYILRSTVRDLTWKISHKLRRFNHYCWTFQIRKNSSKRPSRAPEMPSLCCLGKSADGKDLEKRPVAGGRLTEEEEEDLEEDDSAASGDLVMGDYPHHPSAHPLDPSAAPHPYPHYPGHWYPDPTSETRSNGSERWCPPLSAASSTIARARNRSQASLPPNPRVGAPRWEVSVPCRPPERRLGPDAPSRRCLTPDPARTLALGLAPVPGPRGAASPPPPAALRLLRAAADGRLHPPQSPGARAAPPGRLPAFAGAG